MESSQNEQTKIRTSEIQKLNQNLKSYLKVAFEGDYSVSFSDREITEELQIQEELNLI
jgi:hypothetical protein